MAIEAGLELRFLGTGDAFSNGGRLQTCMHLAAPGLSILVDFGASSLAAMKRWGVDSRSVDAVVVSHLHGDHFGGLPFLLLEGEFSARRERPLVIAGPPGIEERTRAAQEVLFPGSSAIELRYDLRFLALAEREPTNVAGLQVTTLPVIHPSGAPSYALRLGWQDKVVAYSGDTEWTEVLLEVADGADLFVCECYRYAPGVPYHLDYQTLMTRRPDLRCRRILLTHLHTDMLERDGLELERAEDGLSVTI